MSEGSVRSTREDKKRTGGCASQSYRQRHTPINAGEDETLESFPLEQPAASPTKRLASLDVLRGMTIALMILVNNSNQYSYRQLHHSAWNGCTLTDLVFPAFLFLMGASIVFSFQSRLSRGLSRKKLLVHASQRFVILFLLGLVVNGFPFFPLGTLRIYGVLQRIAICFLLAAILYLWDRGFTSKVALVLVALLGYWFVMRWIPVPGYGHPGRDIPFLDKNINLAAYLDRHIFPRRLYRGTRDPEGLLSDLPAMATTLIGMLTGMWLRSRHTLGQKCLGMAGAGMLLIALGQLWNPWFPINKRLWTSSYVLFTAGVCLLCWALCYWAVEIKEWKRGWTGFWLAFGANAITAYMISELLEKALKQLHVPGRNSALAVLYAHIFAPVHPPAVGALLYAITFVLVCWLPVFVLYRKRIFIKI